MKASTEKPSRKIKAQMRQLIDHLRAEVGNVSDPRSQALFETTAEVLIGLVKAFDDHDKKNEPAWQTTPAKPVRKPAVPPERAGLPLDGQKARARRNT